MIFKIQRRLGGNDPETVGKVLVYNQDRSLQEFLPETPDLLELMGDEPKLYVEAEVDGEGMLQINGWELPSQHQDW